MADEDSRENNAKSSEKTKSIDYDDKCNDYNNRLCYFKLKERR